jgi:hypothetical protein
MSFPWANEDGNAGNQQLGKKQTPRNQPCEINNVFAHQDGNQQANKPNGRVHSAAAPWGTEADMSGNNQQQQRRTSRAPQQQQQQQQQQQYNNQNNNANNQNNANNANQDGSYAANQAAASAIKQRNAGSGNMGGIMGGY